MASSTGIMSIFHSTIAFSSFILLSLLVLSSQFTHLDFNLILRPCGCVSPLLLVCWWQQRKLKIQLLPQQTQRQPLFQLPVEILLIMQRVKILFLSKSFLVPGTALFDLVVQQKSGSRPNRPTTASGVCPLNLLSLPAL